MSEAALTFCFFLFALASVGAALLAFRWRTLSRPIDVAEQLDAGRKDGGLKLGLKQSMLYVAELAPGRQKPARSLREQLVAAGYRGEAAVKVFHGSRISLAIAGAIVCGWAGLLARDSLSTAVLMAVCGGGFCFMVPQRFLERRASRRMEKIEEALPAALDLLVLSVEAGQPLDAGLADAARQLYSLYPDLSAELLQAQMEIRAGRQRAEVLYELGNRTGSDELRKLTRVLIDADRFGTSLGPALRTHGKYMRTRRRQLAQEAARKLGVKLVFPVFFLIMPSVFVVTLGPAILQFLGALKPLLENL